MNRWHEPTSSSERVASTDEGTDRWRTWTDATGDRVGLDEQVGLLTDADRRYLLECLSSGPHQMGLQPLVDCVVASHGGSADAERVLLRLHHVHLPGLAAAGVLSYEVESRRVTGRTDRIDALLELREAAVA